MNTADTDAGILSLAELLALGKLLDGRPEIVEWNRMVDQPFIDPRVKRSHRGKRGGKRAAGRT